MAQHSITITLDITEEHEERVGELLDILGARLEYIIGEEFGDPAVTHREDMNWAGDLYIDADTFPKVTDITIDSPYLPL